MDPILCEGCGKRPASRVITVEQNGRNRPIYRCDVCAEAHIRSSGAPARLRQPCERCRKAEGRTKLTRLVKGRRRVSFVCEKCARSR